MDALARLIGLQAVYELFGRIDRRTARVLSVVVLVVVNLYPLVQVVTRRWQPGDVLVMFWTENTVIWFWTIVKILTARGAPTPTSGARGGRSSGFTVDFGLGEQSLDEAKESLSGCARPALAAFFTVHYGIFTFVHGAFTLLVATAVGFRSAPGPYLWGAALVFLSHGISTALYWFARHERDNVSPAAAMIQPYPRVVILHLVVMASFGLVMFGAFQLMQGQASTAGPFAWLREASDAVDARLWPAILLVVVKIVVDLVAHLRQHRDTD